MSYVEKAIEVLNRREGADPFMRGSRRARKLSVGRRMPCDHTDPAALLSEHLGVTFTYVVLTENGQSAAPRTATDRVGATGGASEAQARVLVQHVFALKRVLTITNIYAHPLIRHSEILFGHRLVSFAGAPICNSFGHLLGAICAMDTKAREWTDADAEALMAAAVLASEGTGRKT